ncbi:MAG TPA: flagellar basal body-associated FliL family protein [Lachnospiraceae bacterium]|nr:flagellar basal body-associated FliL family protein [Lachnospiraceae bacterium]
MKKNLMSILILALLVVNIALTAIMMFSVTGAMKSTTSLVSKVAAVLDLELNMGTEESQIPIKNIESHDIADAMTILLKNSEDGSQHYALIAVSLQLDKKNKDFKEYVETLTTNESIIKGEIIDVVSSYTIDEFQSDTDGIKNEILAKLRSVYKSDFIYRVVFSDVKVY